MDYFTIGKLKTKSWAHIIGGYQDTPENLVCNILQNENNFSRDAYSPMKKGPDWLYEELAI